jgi:septum formation topological specificity factor MinE
MVDMTGRKDRSGIHVRKDIDPLLEFIAMAHYSVYYHLGKASFLQSSSDQEFFEDILFHLITATEMVERLIFIIAKLKFQMEKQDLAKQLPQNKILSIVQKYIDNDYENDFGYFLDKGRAVNVHLHKIEEVIRNFMQIISQKAYDDYDEWLKHVYPIRHYRNVLAHNPLLGKLKPVNENYFIIPKEDKLHLFERWSQVFYHSSINDFVKLIDLLADFQQNLIKHTNILWENLIDIMKALSTKEDYKRLLKVSELTIPGTFNALISSSTWIASGTSSYDPTK